MFGAESFFFFFQLINNWPSSMFYVWDSTILPSKGKLLIEVSSRRGQPVPMDSATDYLTVFGSTVVSVCKNYNSTENYTFKWELSRKGRLEKSARGRNCSINFWLREDDDYTIAVTIMNVGGGVVGSTERTWRERKIWIVAMGDSFASGDGNPDRPKTNLKPAEWTDAACRRSQKSFAALVARAQAAAHPESTVYFSFLACSGASAEHGILEDRRKTSQIDRVEEMTVIRGRGPDVLLLTVGGNDIGFAEVLHSLRNARETHPSYDSRFFFVSRQLDRIANRLKSLKIGRIVLPQYYDMTRNGRGEVDASCSAFHRISTERLQDAERDVLRRLNGLLLRKATENGWTIVDTVPKIFRNKGTCATNSLIRNPLESMRLQGSPSGAFHPNEQGHRLVAEEIQKLLHIQTAEKYS